jgi:hypothetical protein
VVRLDPGQSDRGAVTVNKSALVHRMPREVRSMSRFVVRFMKDVLGENGRQAEICQSIVEVDASDEDDATELAKQKFCKTESLCHWSLHADRLHVKKTDFPS